jgi:hypothetical protein
MCVKSTATTGINEDLINEQNSASAKADELDVAGGLEGLLVDTLLDQFDMGFGILMDRDGTYSLQQVIDDIYISNIENEV